MPGEIGQERGVKRGKKGSEKCGMIIQFQNNKEYRIPIFISLSRSPANKYFCNGKTILMKLMVSNPQNSPSPLLSRVQGPKIATSDQQSFLLPQVVPLLYLSLASNTNNFKNKVHLACNTHLLEPEAWFLLQRHIYSFLRQTQCHVALHKPTSGCHLLEQLCC